MLTACRTQQNPDVQPNFDLTGADVEGFLDQLHEFHQAFHSCFVRREPREHFLRYMAGQLSSLERKSIEPMAIQRIGIPKPTDRHSKAAFLPRAAAASPVAAARRLWTARP